MRLLLLRIYNWSIIRCPNTMQLYYVFGWLAHSSCIASQLNTLYRRQSFRFDSRNNCGKLKMGHRRRHRRGDPMALVNYFDSLLIGMRMHAPIHSAGPNRLFAIKMRRRWILTDSFGSHKTHDAHRQLADAYLNRKRWSFVASRVSRRIIYINNRVIADLLMEESNYI